MRKIFNFEAVFIIFTLFFSFVLSADIGEEGDYCMDRYKPIDDSELDKRSEEGQGISCSDKCMYFSNARNVYCIKKTEEDKEINRVFKNNMSLSIDENDKPYIAVDSDIDLSCINSIGYYMHHIGDIDSHDGSIYVSTDNDDNGEGIVIVLSEHDYSVKKIIKIPKNLNNTGMPWVAVNPFDGILYTPCNSKMALCGYNFTSFVKDENYSADCPIYTMPENDIEPDVLVTGFLKSMCQGGSFSENGVFSTSICNDKEDGYGSKFFSISKERNGKAVAKYLSKNVVYNDSERGENEGVAFANDTLCGGFEGEFFYHFLDNDNIKWDWSNPNNDDTTIYAYSNCNNDFDDDEVSDLSDNCPADKNPEQFDFNSDGYGNACDYDIDGDGFLNEVDKTPYYYDETNSEYTFCYDSDFDRVCDDEVRLSSSEISEEIWSEMQGADPFTTVDVMGGLFFAREDENIFNITDNCPGIPNPSIGTSLNDELISGECRSGMDEDGLCVNSLEGGVIRNLNTYQNGHYKYYGTGIFSSRVWEWQPDTDLDGIADACDSALIAGGDGFKIVSRLISSPSDFYDGNSSGDSVSGMRFSGRAYLNRFVDINYYVDGRTDNVDIQDDPDASNTKVSTMYCWVRDNDFDEFGKEGFCTRNDTGDFVLPFTPKFGYSHGSDPKPYRTQGTVTTFSWKDPVKNSTEYYDNRAKITWDWLENLKNEYPFLYQDYVTDLKGNENFMKYTVSSGVKDKSSPLASHLISDTAGGYEVNPSFFHNKKIFARARRDQAHDMKGTFLSYFEMDYGGSIPGIIYINPYPRYPEYIDSCPECWHMPEGLNGLINIWKYDAMEGVLNTTMKGLSPAGEIKTYLSAADSTVVTISKYEEALVISFNRGNLSDMTVAAVTTFPSDGIVSGKAAFAGETLYFTGENTLYTVQRASDGTQAHSAQELPLANLVTVAQLPYPAEQLRFFGIGNDLYALHDDGRTLRMYRLEDDQFVDAADSGNYPVSRMQGAFKVINNELYLAGGGNSDGENIERFSDVWKYNTETGWTQIADNLEMETLDLFIESDGEKLYLFSRTYPDAQVETAVLNLINGTVEYGKTEITGDAVMTLPEEKICLNRNGNSVFPGKLKYSQCIGFEEYQYKNYSFFDYKFSLAGKEKYLFAGGLTGIRTLEINEDGTLNLTHFKTIGLINSVAVSGDTLFAAGGNRVYIFKIGSDGKLTETGSIKTDECWNIRVKDGYLFTGENGKVKIYAVNEDSAPELIKKISLSYQVKDIEINGISLFVYHEAGFWFWKKNEVQKIDISDVYNPVKLNKISFECVDVEFTVDRGTVYMGCKNGQREIVENGSSFSLKTVSGKKNYFRDSYFYNGTGYTVHSGSIHLSR